MINDIKSIIQRNAGDGNLTLGNDLGALRMVGH